MNTNQLLKITRLIFLFLISSVLLSITTRAATNEEKTIKIKAIYLFLDNDTLREFAASIVNDNTFKHEFFKDSTLLNQSLIITNDSKLLITYEGNIYPIDNIYTYVDVKESKEVVVKYYIRKIAYACCEIEFTMKGKRTISKNAAPHNTGDKNCNYVIIDGVK